MRKRAGRVRDAVGMIRRVIETERLRLRPPAEDDRARLVELFTDASFMVFYDGSHTEADAHARFDSMVHHCAELSYAKQAVVERSTGRIVGYTGIDPYEHEGRRALELGYRLEERARGKGYATEASVAVLAAARDAGVDEIDGLVHPDNAPSRNVLDKLGFTLVGEHVVFGRPTLVHVLRLR